MENTFSIDEFLSRKPTKPKFLATLEKSRNDDSKIIIKQYFDNEESCSCDRSFEIDKNLIKEVIMTEITKKCCGGIHNIVEVVFVENFNLGFDGFITILNKFTSELNKKSINENFKINQLSPLEREEGNCYPGWRQCDPRNPYDCYNPKDSCCCYDPRFGNYSIRGLNGNCGYTCAH